MTPLDLSSIYAIALSRTTTTLTVLYCGMYMQHPKICMYMIRRALCLFTCGAKNPLSTNTCQHRNTCLYSGHISPVKYRLAIVHTE